MNYFAHAFQILDRPYLAAGACVPDWLAVADRPLRLRTKHAEPFVNDPDPEVSAVAQGIVKHLRDDARFHATRAFAETSLALTVMARDVLGCDTGFRPAFLGHLLTEIFLDASLIAENPEKLSEFYRVLDPLDPRRIEAAVNRMAPRPTTRLAVFIPLFLRERILWNYLEDDKLMMRLNQIMWRVKQSPLPDEFIAIFPAARKLVEERKEALLEPVTNH